MDQLCSNDFHVVGSVHFLTSQLGCAFSCRMESYWHCHLRYRLCGSHFLRSAASAQIHFFLAEVPLDKCKRLAGSQKIARPSCYLTPR